MGTVPSSAMGSCYECYKATSHALEERRGSAPCKGGGGGPGRSTGGGVFAAVSFCSDCVSISILLGGCKSHPLLLWRRWRGGLTSLELARRQGRRCGRGFRRRRLHRSLRCRYRLHHPIRNEDGASCTSPSTGADEKISASSPPSLPVAAPPPALRRRWRR